MIGSGRNIVIYVIWETHKFKNKKLKILNEKQNVSGKEVVDSDRR